MKKNFEFDSALLKNSDQYNGDLIYKTTIYNVSSLSNPDDNTLIFADKLSENDIKQLSRIKECIILLKTEYSDLEFKNNCVIYVDRPRREYAKILKFILDTQKKDSKTYVLNSNGYCIGENIEIGKNTIIEPYVFIDHNVTIGDNCIIRTGAKLRKNTIIGDNSIIKENTVIGDDGFGIERDEDGTTYRIPHLGGVIIGNNVEVGALVSIAQGTINPTIIQDYVKIDDCCFIAHNCNVGKGTFLIANSEISGSVSIGRNSWVAPNACIKDGLQIGDNVIIGMGTVVLNDIEDNTIVVGNPARKINKVSTIY